MLSLLSGVADAAGRRRKPNLSLGKVLDTLNLIPKASEIESTLNRLQSKPLLQDMTCDMAVDRLYMNLNTSDAFGSIFYVLVNGWYLGNWGDYGSCLSDATYGQYIMTTISGDYDQKNKPLFTRGAYGKYSNFTTRLGLCMPKQCKEADLEAMNEKYINMSLAANWTNPRVTYRFSSRDDAAMMAQPASAGLSIVLAAIIILMVLGIAGTIVELTRIGDKPNLDYKRLDPVSKFVSIKQYEQVALKRKKPWAQSSLIFSALHNFMSLSKQPRAY